MFLSPHEIPKNRAGKITLIFSREYLQRTLGEDQEILDRITAAYHHAREKAPADIRAAMWGPVWSEQGNAQKQGALVEALENRSASALHGILCKYFLSDPTQGIAMGNKEKASQEQHPEMFEDSYRTKLVGLAHVIGALPVPYPEADPEGWRISLAADPETVVRAIEKRLGMELSFPDICGAYGLCLHGRPFNGRSFTHVLAAWQIRSLVGPENPNIAEIGGGFGGLAYFTSRLVSAHYTIFDLPFMNAVQAYFLNRALPDRRLVLAGETPAKVPAVGLLPGWNLWNLPADYRAHLVVNQDSLPEIPLQTACLYLEAMKNFLNGPFLSINHEYFAGSPNGLSSVQRMTEKVGGFTCLNRSHFSMRPGYVQEIYLLAGKAGGFLQPRDLRQQAGKVGAAHRSGKNPVRRLLRVLKRGARAGLAKLVR